MVQLIILTDLDGSLLDATSYSHNAATEALQQIQDLRIPIVLVSSKTRAEMEPLRIRLRNRHPFIVENGGGIFIPRSYFPFLVEQAPVRGQYQVVELGLPYMELRVALKEIEQDLGYGLLGFGDMSMEEVAHYTGLSPADAALAKQREFDEPFLIDHDGITCEDLRPYVESRGLRCTKGGRFFHLMGTSDKGRASRLVLEWYRRHAESQGREVVSIGLGDSLNDLPMLKAVDRPILVQKPDGTYDPDIHLPHLNYAEGSGPIGWNKAVLAILHDT
jgi:mannosyl-3-phosphoglycerate phosphatase